MQFNTITFIVCRQLNLKPLAHQSRALITRKTGAHWTLYFFILKQIKTKNLLHSFHKVYLNFKSKIVVLFSCCFFPFREYFRSDVLLLGIYHTGLQFITCHYFLKLIKSILIKYNIYNISVILLFLLSIPHRLLEAWISTCWHIVVYLVKILFSEKKYWINRFSFTILSRLFKC